MPGWLTSDVVISIITTLGAAVMLVLTAFVNIKQKKTEAKLDIEASERREELEERRAIRNSQDNKMNEILRSTTMVADKLTRLEENVAANTTQLKSIQSDIDRMENFDTTISRKVTNIAASTNRITGYVSRIGSLTSALAIGMRDNNLDGKVTDNAASLAEYEHQMAQEHLNTGD